MFCRLRIARLATPSLMPVARLLPSTPIARLLHSRVTTLLPTRPPATRLLPSPPPLRKLCSAAAPVEEHYAQSIKILHWVMGAAMLTCMGTVKLSQWTTADTWWNGYVSAKGTKGATKGALMMIHKSTAVLVAAMIVPRVLLRMVTKAPTPLEGPALEHFAANVSHTALYGFMLAMPATGIAMGYYGGKGVPFYGLYTFPGKGSPGMPAKEKEDGKFAGTIVQVAHVDGPVHLLPAARPRRRRRPPHLQGPADPLADQPARLAQVAPACVPSPITEPCTLYSN